MCVGGGNPALKSHTLPTSIKACGHSHYPHLSFLSHQENVAVENTRALLRPEPSFSCNQMLESIRLPWEPGCLSSSWFHFDLKSRPQIHPDPLALHPGKLLELSGRGSYLVSLLNLHLNSIPRVPDALGVG